MFMLGYIAAIKRKLRDQYGFTPKPGSSESDPVFDHIPDGKYPMEIDGKLDKVTISGGKINCCNFD